MPGGTRYRAGVLYRPLARVERQRSDGSGLRLVHTRYQRVRIEVFAVLDYTPSITSVTAMRGFATPRDHARTPLARERFTARWHLDCTQ